MITATQVYRNFKPRMSTFLVILITSVVCYLLCNVEFQATFSRKPGVASNEYANSISGVQSSASVPVGYATTITLDLHPTYPHKTYNLFGGEGSGDSK